MGPQEIIERIAAAKKEATRMNAEARAATDVWLKGQIWSLQAECRRNGHLYAAIPGQLSVSPEFCLVCCEERPTP